MGHTEGKEGRLVSSKGRWRVLQEIGTSRGWWQRLEDTAGSVGGAGRLDQGAHPASFALILDGLFGVGHGPLHEAHRLVHVVLNAVNHGSLSPDARAGGGSSGRRRR